MCPGDAFVAVGAKINNNMVLFLNKLGTVKCRSIRGWIIKQVKDELLVDQALAIATDECVEINVKPNRQRSRGLGDTIAKVTKAVGIKPCGGCEKRRALLNKLVPYKD